MWRTGHRVKLNVYDGERPVCQCHNVEDAESIVDAMNGNEKAALEGMVAELCEVRQQTNNPRWPWLESRIEHHRTRLRELEGE